MVPWSSASHTFPRALVSPPEVKLEAPSVSVDSVPHSSAVHEKLSSSSYHQVKPLVSV